MEKIIRIGIVGGGGYVAGELLRLLEHHPHVSIDFLYSHSQAGKRVQEVHQDLLECTLTFTDKVQSDVDVVFLCLGHGQAGAFLEQHSFASHTRVIDLSNDFRLKANAQSGEKSFLYGLVELNRHAIRNAQWIANPGCFATAIELALLPLAHAQLLKDEIHVHAVTGSTGAGQTLSDTSHFSWRHSNLSIYKAFRHQHLDEIRESISVLQPGFSQAINFIPMRGDFARGIFSSVYTNCTLDAHDLHDLYAGFYRTSTFTTLSNDTVHLKQVVNTNRCILQVQHLDGKVHITSILDNLLKGAAGQAVQNMNIMFGLEETIGLQLKASYF